jgi:putative endonuclease
MYSVYLIQSDVDNSFYVGYSQDPHKRLLAHNNGESTYTRRKMPWKLVYIEQYSTKSEALKREIFLKAQRNTEFYKKLIKESLDR